jgi:hypothetical protein
MPEKYQLEQLMRDDPLVRHDEKLIFKIGIRINESEDELIVPVFTFYRDEDNEDEINYKVTSMHLVSDIDQVNVGLFSGGIISLESAFKYIIDIENLYRSCNLNVPSVICVSENSLPAQDYFEQEQ